MEITTQANAIAAKESAMQERLYPGARAWPPSYPACDITNPTS